MDEQATAQDVCIPRPAHAPDAVFTDGPNAGKRMATIGWITSGPGAGRWVVPSDMFYEAVPGQRIVYGKALSDENRAKLVRALAVIPHGFRASRRRAV